MFACDDVARFGAEDDPALVAASFACPTCLGLDHTGQLVIEADESEVRCACDPCGTTWSVAVDSAQLLRLVLHPPVAGRDTVLRILPPRAERFLR